jgi:hypothetical protein
MTSLDVANNAATRSAPSPAPTPIPAGHCGAPASIGKSRADACDDRFEREIVSVHTGDRGKADRGASHGLT